MVERLWQVTSKNSHDCLDAWLIMPDDYALVCMVRRNTHGLFSV